MIHNIEIKLGGTLKASDSNKLTHKGTGRVITSPLS